MWLFEKNRITTPIATDSQATVALFAIVATTEDYSEVQRQL